MAKFLAGKGLASRQHALLLAPAPAMPPLSGNGWQQLPAVDTLTKQKFPRPNLSGKHFINKCQLPRHSEI